MSKPPSVFRFLFWGGIQGAAAWGAYAVVEFFFSSILFGIMRPYAVFPAWHWRLTAMLLMGFFAAGIASGAIAAALLWMARRRDDAPPVLADAGGLTVTLAFAANVIFGYSDTGGYGWLVLVAAPLAVLQIAAVLSEDWRGKLGLLTNYWISSGLLLGFGMVLRIRDMGVAGQLGSNLSLWSWALAAILIAAAAGSVWVGRVLLARFESVAIASRICAGSLAVACVLLIVSGVLSMGGPAGVQAAAEIGSQTQPNVVVIVMDTVRADHLSVYGYDRDTTPNLRALARDSVVYPNAASASDITLTSHASLFTGMYPSWHGAYCDPETAPYGGKLFAQVPTLAELVKAKGYSTVAVAANMYLRADFGLERGFDEFLIPRPVAMLPADTPYLLRRSVRRGLNLGFNTAQFDRLYSLGEDIDAHLFSLMARQGSKPFLVFLNYMDAHFPYVPPAPYEHAFPGQSRGMTQEDLEIDQMRVVKGKPVSQSYLPNCLSKYDGGINYVDAQVGKVVEWLKQRKAYDNTMIVIASDHGEAFGERRRIGHGNSPYQNVLHVALMIKYPGNARRGTEPTPASLIDVVPTVLSALNLPVPPTVQGRDLNHPEALKDRVLYSETFPCPVTQAPECPGGCTARAVYAWPYKFIKSSNGKRELFDLTKDPLEEHTIYAKQRPDANRLLAHLESLMKAMPARSSQKHVLSNEDRKRLEGIGYIGR